MKGTHWTGLLWILPVIFLVAGWSPVLAANSQAGPDFAAIDEYIQQQMKKNRIPGISLAITQGDQIVHLGGFGVADPSGRPVTPQTPLLIGSVSKSFTALAVMQLVEGGKIDLNAPVQRYLPWFRVADPAASAQITVRHLLNQTSGLTTSAGNENDNDGRTDDGALERDVRSLSTVYLANPPGAVMRYSNANYSTLGLIVQVVSGQSYEAYIQQHIFNPLGMQHSYTSKAEAQQNGLATGYRMWFGFPAPAPDLPYPRRYIAGGYLISSAEDLAHYLIAQNNEGRFGGETVLSPEGIAALHSPAVNVTATAFPPLYGCDEQAGGAYGMGWRILELDGIPVICHTGDTPNFHADVVLIPQGKWGIALLMNTSNKLMSEDIHAMINGVTRLVVGQQPVEPKPDIFSRMMFYSMAAVFAVECFLIVKFLLTIRRKRSKQVQVPAGRVARIRYAILPALGSLAGALILTVGFPLLLGYRLSVMLLNQPDYTLLMLLTSGLIFLRGALHSGLNVWRISRVKESL
jgi:CubicO group peptidase (beta-lactamase class C family)